MMKIRKIKIIAVVGVIFTCIAPYILTQCYSSVAFDQDSGVIGDTIGGTTAPIIGILSIVLLSFTLIVQIRSNEKQQEFAANEQFKSTFFNLLQVQRNIAENMKGYFPYLMESVDDEQVLNIKGGDFFIHVRKQLILIFTALNCKAFYNKYDPIEAGKQEIAIDNMQREYEEKFGADILPYTKEGKELDEKIKDMRVDYRFKYINDTYSIKMSNHDLYQRLSMDEKIKTGYKFLFNKYEILDLYFKHLYHILQFVRSTENERLNNRISESEKNKIHAQFKQYAQFVQAQMSTDELLLLYYHSFIQKDLQELIIHYDLLENLPIKDLIVPEHYCNAKIKLSNKEDIQRYLDRSTT